MKLNEFISNDNVINMLSRSISSDTLPHAILIDGVRGTGKAALANILARACVCTGDNKPCDVCPSCKKALHDSHPDISISNGDNSGELSVDAIRRIRSDAYIMPNEAPNKVFLLLNCDKMLAPSQNAFLKVLEEPPANVFFILTVSSANMLLETVRSRSRIYSLNPPDKKEAFDYITSVYPEFSGEDISRAVNSSEGNIGKALELLNNGGEEAALLADEIMNALIFGKEYDLLRLNTRLTASRPFAYSVLDSLSELSAECVRASVGLPTASETAKKAISRLTKQKILKVNDSIQKAKNVLNTNVNLSFYGTWLSSVLKASLQESRS